MKRFSETLRWEEPWYRNLKPRYKCLYEYLWSRCDAAGVWVVDLSLAATFVGEKLDAKEAIASFVGKVVDIGKGKWLLPEFIKIQCGKLSPNSPPHKRVIECLSGHSLTQNSMNEAYPTNSLSNRLPNSLEEEEEKEKEEEDKKRKGEIEGGTPPVEPPADRAMEIYLQYPRHLNRTEALKAIEKAMKTAAPDYLLTRTAEFAMRTKGCDTQFIPYPASWFNAGGYDSDPAEWDKIGRKNGHHTQVPIDYSKGF